MHIFLYIFTFLRYFKRGERQIKQGRRRERAITNLRARKIASQTAEKKKDA